MCNFFSCLVGKDKKVAWREDVDSHENLISIGYPGYKDDDHRILFGDTSMMPFARVEVTPINGDVFSPVKTWQFKIDQAITPQWWTIDHEKAAKEALKKCLSRVLIVGQEIDRLENRNGIFMKDSKIEVVVNCTVRAMRGSSTVSEMRGSSTVREMRDSSTVCAMRGSSTVREMRGSSTVRAMWDSSTVRDMWDSSAVGAMWDSSTVREMRGSSAVGDMWNSSTVCAMRDSSAVRAMRDSTTVGEIRDSSAVGAMWDSSTVREMRGSSTVRAMWDSSTVREMRDSSAVGKMRDSSTVGLYSDKATFAIADGSNGLAVVRHKKDVEIFHAHDVPTTLRKYIKVAGRFYL